MLLGGALCAQSGQPPVLTAQPQVQYPPIARAAHVSGEVEVDFSIDSDGHTYAVQTISGPQMLRGAVEGQIRHWTFQTPLPIGAQTSFRARYTFDLHGNGEDLEDDLDAPPFTPCCGDSIYVMVAEGQIRGDVHSIDGSQKIDVTPGAPAARGDLCPEDKERQAPTTTDPDDFIELHRNNCGRECTEYLVRVYRNGRVEWTGLRHVKSPGFVVARLDAGIGDALLTRFATKEFWTICAGQRLPVPNPDIDGEAQAQKGDYLDVSIGSHRKLVDVFTNGMNKANIQEKLAWAVDTVANTHRWRHGDAATGPWTNMDEDLRYPKPGMTRLIRAAFRFRPTDAELTSEPLKHFLAAGDDVNAADESGWTALMYAAALTLPSNPNVRLLLESHADPNRASFHGETALMFAAYHQYFRPELIDFGARIDTRNADGVTALMLLAQYGDPDLLQQTLEAGADATIQDNAGHTALDYLRAASCGKAFIPLPPIDLYVAKVEEVCPSKGERFLRSQALLLSAMKHAAAR